MTVIQKLARSRKAWATLAAAITLLAGYFHVDLDPENVYMGIAGIFSLYALAQGVADSSTQRAFEPSSEEQKILDLARRIRKGGLDLHEVVELGERVMAVKGVQSPPPPDPPADDPEPPPRLTLGVIAAIGLSLMLPSVAWADGRYACYEESPWFRGLYDTIFLDDDAVAQGAAMGALNRWQCQPVDVDGDGDLDPNPRCDPPPGCAIDIAGSSSEEPEPSQGHVNIPVLVGEDRIIDFPVIRLQRPYQAPVWHPDENTVGNYRCACQQGEIPVGASTTCRFQGAADMAPLWTTDDGNVLLSGFDDNSPSVRVRALAEGRATIMQGNRLCDQIFVTPRSVADQAMALAAADERAEAEAAAEAARLRAAIDAAVDVAVADEREREPPWWKTAGGVVGVISAIAAVAATVLLANDGGSAPAATPLQ